MNPNLESTAQANFAWGQVVAQTLYELGVVTVFFSPGSRSTPLILGFERHPSITCIPVLDERTAAFLALGLSKRTRQPAVLLCTSGSAVTHWFPAITEASHSGIPLLLISADRPDELQDCASGQTINQQELFGSFVRKFYQLPHPSLESTSFQFLQNTLVQAHSQSIHVNPGPVHLNFPFREPFLPKDKPITLNLLPVEPLAKPITNLQKQTSLINNQIKGFCRPLIIAGEFAPASMVIDWLGKCPTPVICDSLSPLRENFLSTRILRYENLLRDSLFAKQAQPDLVIVLGPLPTSKTLRNWVDQSGATRIVIEPKGTPVDPLVSQSHSFKIDYSTLPQIQLPDSEDDWFNLWQVAERRVEEKLTLEFAEKLPSFEGKLTRLLSQYLPPLSFLHVANSMPIRDLEWFWLKSEKGRKLFGNRGVNGIDGTLGTSLGLAHKSGEPTFLLTGELAFLHDSNALLFNQQLLGNLNVFLVNNEGGGIFEHLPIAQQPEFEKCFATPQHCNFSLLCQAHGVELIQPSTWDEIINLIENPISLGIRVVEIKTDRKKDRETRKRLLSLNPS